MKMTTLGAALATLIGLSAQAAHAASEGGDTWSVLTPRPYARPVPIAYATIGKIRDPRPILASPYGTSSDADASDRAVRLGPDTRWIDVAYGESVTFMATDAQGVQREFSWKFAVSPALTHVDLDRIAPGGFPARAIRVFVAEQPEYRGG